MLDETSFSGPLPLKPLLLPKVWGGDRLARLYGKSLPGGAPLGESWEVYHRPQGSSLVKGGPLEGKSLAEILRTDPEGLLGHPSGRGWETFPLMVKFLDARDLLSIQVHPSWEYAARAEGDQGKAEAWVILQAEPGSKVFRGLKPGTTRGALQEACREGTVEKVLHSFSPRAGDVFWIPPGTVHGLGGGVVAYEVQTNSDVTYRLFDWNRPGRDGRPRELHQEKAFDVIDFSRPPLPDPHAGERTEGRVVLLETPWFILERIGPPWKGSVGRRESFTVLTVTEGTLRVGGEGGPTAVAGDTLLLPARLGPVPVEGVGPSPWSLLAATPGSSL